ncbi:hypothetical protein [Microbacterium timonense]|uniref:hypothetical protein n=1 Tax=Microbacterium timonense TaxID=2086576 RepID=UPI000D0EE040|nr:hypothetical protein [Microbacterium timonense]
MAGVERIRRFSALTWIFGTIIIAVIAFLVFPQVVVNPRTGDVYVGDPAEGEDDWPWLVDDPQEYRIVDGMLRGTAEGGFLRLEGDAEMLMFENAEGVDKADWVSVYQQQGVEFDVDSEAWQYPGYLGSLYADGQVLVLPGAQDGLLWFGPSLTDWTATVTTPEVRPMGETVTGQGNAVLLYEGEALSGRFQHTGSGLFAVSAVTVGGWDLLVNDADDVDVRASWKPTDRVVFQVESDTGDGTWTIALDTPAADPTPTTIPTPTPTP